jgi:hypothetical protein
MHAGLFAREKVKPKATHPQDSRTHLARINRNAGLAGSVAQTERASSLASALTPVHRRLDRRAHDNDRSVTDPGISRSAVNGQR